MKVTTSILESMAC